MGTTHELIDLGNRVARIGEAVLCRRSQEVPESEIKELNGLIRKMTKVLKSGDGVGLAAPQIRVLKRVIAFGFEPDPELDQGPLCNGANAAPRTVLINPAFTPVGDEMELGWEGCFCTPGLMGLVPRFKTIEYYGTAPDGTAVERKAEGFHARLVQHEIDHLDGILFPMRIKDLKQFGFKEELEERFRAAR